MFCVNVVVKVLSTTESSSNSFHLYAATIVHMCIQKKKKKKTFQSPVHSVKTTIDEVKDDALRCVACSIARCKGALEVSDR